MEEAVPMRVITWSPGEPYPWMEGKCHAYYLNSKGEFWNCQRYGEFTKSGEPVCYKHFYMAPLHGNCYRNVDEQQIYVMATGSFLKIGHSVDPPRRLKNLRPVGHEMGFVPEELQLVAKAYENETVNEKLVHQRLGFRDRIQGEWWANTPWVRGVLNDFGLTW